MKFLCDNCKAKYQIADEKVAGKTVRMKCRKCGHQIEVRAAVTETSAASQPPRAPMTGVPPRPPPPARSGLATSLSQAKPRAPSPSMAPSSLASAFNRNVQDAPASNATGGVSKSSTIELSVTDEWYVAINGVPVGPVRISELRRKAAAGAVTEESLCWQEGLEEWRPIRSIPDLAALVREAAQGNRPSLIGTPPPEPAYRSPSIPSAPRQPTVPSRSSQTPPPPRPMSPSSPSPGIMGGPPAHTQRSNVVPLRPAASSGIDEIGFGGAAAAYAQSQPMSPFPTPQPLSSPMMPLAPAIDPFAVPPAPQTSLMPAPTPYQPRESGVSPSMLPPQPMQPQPSMYMEQKRGVPLWFWPILVVALGFGGGVAFLVFRPQQAPAPVVIQMPATATAQPTHNNDVPPPPDSSNPTPTTTENKPGGKTGPVAVRTPPKAGTPEEKKGLDLGGLVPNGGGPNVGPGGGGGPAAGGGLDQAGVERVVAVHRNGVKRTCWERGGSDQKSSVNVTVEANVAPNGQVASTSSTGDDPVVAKCIESQVKSWTFPAPGSPTTIKIPFKFVRQ